MKKIILTFSLATCLLLLFGIHNTFAQVMRMQPVSSLLQKLKNDDYIAVQKIQLVNEEYVVQAFDSQGNRTTIRMNPFNGEIIGIEKTESHITMFEVVDKIEAVGYAGISLIEIKNNHYDVVAIGPNGQKTQLSVDAMTGDIKVVPLSLDIAPRKE